MRLLIPTLALALVGCGTDAEPAPASAPTLALALTHPGDGRQDTLALDGVAVPSAVPEYVAVPLSEARGFMFTAPDESADDARDGVFLAELVLEDGRRALFSPSVRARKRSVVEPPFGRFGILDTLLTGELRLYAVPHVWPGAEGAPVVVSDTGTGDTLAVVELPDPVPGTVTLIDPARLGPVAGRSNVSVEASGSGLPPLAVAAPYRNSTGRWIANPFEPQDGGGLRARRVHLRDDVPVLALIRRPE